MVAKELEDSEKLCLVADSQKLIIMVED